MTIRRLAALAGPMLLAAAPPSASDGAGNRTEAFAPAIPVAEGEENRSARHCVTGRLWCAELSRDGESGDWGVNLFEGRAAPRRVALAGQDEGDARFAIRPQLIREAGGAVLIGVERTRSTGFSGGGASATDLVLIRAEPGAAPPAEVLDVPLAGSATIRACFSERDARRRHGACHDEYALSGNVLLDPGTRAGRPRFILTASARTYPGRVSRSEDSTTAPALRRGDLRWAADPACSYRRVLAFDPASGRYAPDAPLPDCPDYFDF